MSHIILDFITIIRFGDKYTLYKDNIVLLPPLSYYFLYYRSRYLHKHPGLCSPSLCFPLKRLGQVFSLSEWHCMSLHHVQRSISFGCRKQHISDLYYTCEACQLHFTYFRANYSIIYSGGHSHKRNYGWPLVSAGINKDRQGRRKSWWGRYVSIS